MAKKASSSDDYKLLMEHLKAGAYRPVYILMGPESYYIDKVYEYIATHVLKEEERDFNLTTVYGQDVTAQQVMDMARRFPMMAERQVVIVREAQGMKDLEQLEKYMDHIVPTTILVICYMGGTIDARKKLLSKAATVGTVLVSEAPRYDSGLVKFIEEYVAESEHKAKIDPRAAQVIAAHIGGDLKRLSSELDKLFIGMQDGAVITANDVEQKIGISKSFNVFELRDAFIAKDAAKAFRIAKYYNDNPKAGGLFAILPITFSFFQNLMLCYYAERPITENSVAAQLGLKSPYGAKDYIAAMRNYPARKTLAIVSKLREIDARSKGLDNVSTPPSELLQELVAYILS